jgi:hypothetical protein
MNLSAVECGSLATSESIKRKMMGGQPTAGRQTAVLGFESPAFTYLSINNDHLPFVNCSRNLLSNELAER